MIYAIYMLIPVWYFADDWAAAADDDDCTYVYRRTDSIAAVCFGMLMNARAVIAAGDAAAGAARTNRILYYSCGKFGSEADPVHVYIISRKYTCVYDILHTNYNNNMYITRTHTHKRALAYQLAPNIKYYNTHCIYYVRMWVGGRCRCCSCSCCSSSVPARN